MKKIPEHEREIIEQLFYELQFVNSYYTTLQLLYNNSNHFSTISADKNLCTYQVLNHIGYISQSENKIYIEGTIHSNYHISNVLFDKYTNRPLFVKDTYIRFSYDNINFMHLLVTPPNIEGGNVNEYVYYNESFENGMCDLPYPDTPHGSLIEPTINNQYMGGIKNKYKKTKTYRVNKIKKYQFKKTKKSVKNRSSKKTINNRRKNLF